MTHRSDGRDLTRVVLQVLWIGILIAASFWIMKPFLPSLLWAAMIVAATWPLMTKVEAWLWNRRGLAVAVMTAAMLLVFIVPFTLAVTTIIGHSDEIAAWVKSLGTQALPPPPDWVAGLPGVGPKLQSAWESAAAAGPEGLSARLAPYAGKVVNWFLDQAGSVGLIVVQFLLTVVIAAIFYYKGETAAAGVLRFARRLGGRRGEEVSELAAKTVRSVALGVVGTALIQSVLGGVGLAIAGVPAATLLTAVMFILCVAQLGVAFVLFPAVIWLYWTDQNLWGTILLVWSVIVGTLDNVVRPLLIKRGADLPLILILTGVIGGLIAFGVVGLFIGPVVLAVAYKLLAAWVDGDAADSAGEPAGKT